MLDEQTFQAALLRAGAARRGAGIGTLGEKTLHTVLKYCYEPDERWHEVKTGGYVADILGSDGIIEIQTRNFSSFRRKLGSLLAEGRVTVVYPVAHTKWLSWIDPQTGEVTKKRRSPKTGTAYEIFRELVYIKPLLNHPNLSLRIVLLDVEETRFLNGWSHDRKRGSSRCERFPVALCGELSVDRAADYALFLPQSLPGQFTTVDLAAQGGISAAAARTALNVLACVGAVRQAGRRGRFNLYERQPRQE